MSPRSIELRFCRTVREAARSQRGETAACLRRDRRAAPRSALRRSTRVAVGWLRSIATNALGIPGQLAIDRRTGDRSL